MNQTSKPEPQVFDIEKTMRKSEFADTLAKAQHGDKIIYARGVTVGGINKQAALDAQEAGLVALVQKRLGKGRFEYIAQRTKKRIKK